MNPEQAYGLMGAAEELLKMYEFAEGQRAVLVERGWSQGAAEQVVVGILDGMIDMAFRR